MILPTKPKQQVIPEIKKMILVGPPKIGKTSFLSQFGEHCLVLNFEEGGTAFIKEIMAVDVFNWNALTDVLKALEEAKKEKKGPVYKFIAMDTLTMLTDIVEQRLTAQYKKENPTFAGSTILDLPYGQGYGMLKNTLWNLTVKIASYCESMILVAHQSTSTVGESEVQRKTIATKGSIGTYFASQVDAVCLLYVEPIEGKVFMSFRTNDYHCAGTRHPDLVGYEGPLDAYKIFPSLKNAKTS